MGKRRHRTDDLTRFGKMLQGSTGWQNVCNMLGDAILKYVALKCCASLAGPLNLFKAYSVT